MECRKHWKCPISWAGVEWTIIWSISLKSATNTASFKSHKLITNHPHAWLFQGGVGKMSSCGPDTPLSSAHRDLLSQFHFKPISCKPKHTKECYNFPLLVCPTPSVMGLLMCSNSFSTAVESQVFLSLFPIGTWSNPSFSRNFHLESLNNKRETLFPEPESKMSGRGPF